jgi:hypothetical protein
MDLQKQQFDQQMELQRQQMAEQKRIAEAPPPPAPSPTATAAASAVELPAAIGTGGSAEMAIPLRTGLGRRRLRTDIAGGTGGLSIPAA